MRRVFVLIVSLFPALALAFAGPPPATRFADDLPARLSNQEFWALSVELSEPGETFISDNLVSNEMSFAQVIPELAALPASGVFLGVGPEQNFSFLAAMKPRMAFIIDIRKDNLLLHLMYKALFNLSPTRAAFVSRLFSRGSLTSVDESARASDLMDAAAKAAVASATEFRGNVEQLRTNLVDDLQWPLSTADNAAIAKAYGAFHQYGPAIGYATVQLGRPVGLASYANLMKQTDAEGRELGYLASETSYQLVRELHRKNLIVPVVGNFAGTTAIRGIGHYLRAHNATVSAFYVSNVEEYLGRARVPQNGEWAVFCENVASLPTNDRSVFVRPLGLAAFDSERRLMVSPSMQIASKNFDVYLPGAYPALSKALSAIEPEVLHCK